ncbi:hypothetical protein PG910_10430 [Tenacibaculum dicentrarchi]|nr:hypothetical protein PG910_10430 [Tenacibaculum dicentrarchi]
MILFLPVVGFSQHKFTSYSAHTSITMAIRVNNEIIAGRTAFFEKQSEEKTVDVSAYENENCRAK